MPLLYYSLLTSQKSALLSFIFAVFYFLIVHTYISRSNRRLDVFIKSLFAMFVFYYNKRCV
jgi:hypothetical protein